jgi:hypothetical protein
MTAADSSEEKWDTGINVGTTDSDDLLQYKLAYDCSHPMTAALRAAGQGFSDRTGKR